MTPSLEAMAREAGAFLPGPSRNYWAVTDPALARFAAIVRAQALEDAALVADEYYKSKTAPSSTCRHIAAAIRAISIAEVAPCKKPAT